jgi:hypothetical protein
MQFCKTTKHLLNIAILSHYIKWDTPLTELLYTVSGGNSFVHTFLFTAINNNNVIVVVTTTTTTSSFL